jgi:hypothetical protein
MTLKQLKKYYGSYYAAAIAIGITQQSITHWIRNGSIPIKRQFQIQKLTKGKLKAKYEKSN